MNVRELEPRKKPPGNEGCENASVPRITERWARGIITVHEGCEPPCPRKATALRRLAELSATGDRRTRPTAWHRSTAGSFRAHLVHRPYPSVRQHVQVFHL